MEVLDQCSPFAEERESTEGQFPFELDRICPALAETKPLSMYIYSEVLFALANMLLNVIM